MVFSNALFTQNNRRSLIIATGVKDTSDGRGQGTKKFFDYVETMSVAVSCDGLEIFVVPRRRFQENVGLIKLVVTDKSVKVGVAGEIFFDIGDSGFDGFSKTSM